VTGAGARRRDGQPPTHRSPDFLRVKQKIVETTGLHYYNDRDDTLLDQIRRQSVAHNLDEAEYCRRLLGPEGAEAFDQFTNRIAIGETYFFRYPEQIEALRNTIIPRCLARGCEDGRSEDRRLAIWSAGCATGAEPYTLSILLKSEFAAQLDGWRVSILGTDINRDALVQARTALFSNWELRTADNDLKQRCFTPVAGKWSLRPQYRRDVEFAHQNFAADLDSFARQWRGAFDIILCRNVMIYFDKPLQEHVHRLFHESLARLGVLALGQKETIRFSPHEDCYEVLDPAEKLYRKLR